MRKLVVLIVIAIVIGSSWFGIWRAMLSDDVARVEATIEHHNRQFKAVNRNVVLKADKVEAAGFPFQFKVRVKRPTLTLIDGKTTFGVSLPEMVLSPEDADQGRYPVELPSSFDAVYATDGAAPENYKVTPNMLPVVLLRAQGDSGQCSPMPGAQRCEPVSADAPLITFAAQLPTTLVLHMELNGQSRDASFNFTPVNIPIFIAIPNQVANPLELFIGVLREALVYKTQG